MKCIFGHVIVLMLELIVELVYGLWLMQINIFYILFFLLDSWVIEIRTRINARVKLRKVFLLLGCLQGDSTLLHFGCQLLSSKNPISHGLQLSISCYLFINGSKVKVDNGE